MFSTNYYTLVAGFREYALDAAAKGFDIEAILEEVLETVSASDARAVRLLYARYDCENLVARRNSSSAHEALGRLTPDEVGEELAAPGRLGGAVAEVLRAYADPEGEDAESVDTSRPFATTLMAAYYADCARSSSKFLREWSEAERTLRNVVAASVARARQLPTEDVLVGGGDVVEQLQRSSAADFGLRGELSYVDALIATVADEQNLVEKERKIDLIRWDIASQLSSFDYFDINAVLAYLVKVNMVARWSRLDAKAGREMFDRLMGELDGRKMIDKL